MKKKNQKNDANRHYVFLKIKPASRAAQDMQREVRLAYDPTTHTYSGDPRAEEIMLAYEVILTAEDGSVQLHDAQWTIWNWQLEKFEVLLAQWCEHENQTTNCAQCTSPPCCPFCDSPLTQVDVQTNTRRDGHGTLTQLHTRIVELPEYVYKSQIHVLRCCTQESAQAECTCQDRADDPFQNISNLQ